MQMDKTELGDNTVVTADVQATDRLLVDVHCNNDLLFTLYM